MNHYNTTYVATRDDLDHNIVASCNNVAKYHEVKRLW